MLFVIEMLYLFSIFSPLAIVMEGRPPRKGRPPVCFAPLYKEARLVMLN